MNIFEYFRYLYFYVGLFELRSSIIKKKINNLQWDTAQNMGPPNKVGVEVTTVKKGRG